MSDFVSLSYIDEYNTKKIEEAIKNSLNVLGFDKIRPKMKVMLKVCAPYDFAPDLAKTSHPAVVCAVANVLVDMGADVIVAESPYSNYSVEELDNVYVNTGMLEVANSSKCTLNHNLKSFVKELPNGQIAKSVRLLDIVNDVDAIVNVGKLKLDEQFGICGATSNLFGLIPGEGKTLALNRLNTMCDLNNFLIDIKECLNDKLVLNVVDGIVALEAGDVQHMMYCLAIGENPYRVDACLADILNVDLKNTIVKQADERGLIKLQHPYKSIGEDVQRFKQDTFALMDFNEETPLHKNKLSQKQYFKSHQMRVKIDKNTCKGCSVCSRICPTGAIVMRYDKNNDLYAEIDYKKCIYCFKCHTACPYKVVDVIIPLKYKRLDAQLNKYNEKGE